MPKNGVLINFFGNNKKDPSKKIIYYIKQTVHKFV